MAGNGKLPSLIQLVPDGVDATSLAVGPQGVALATDGGWSEDRASFGMIRCLVPRPTYIECLEPACLSPHISPQLAFALTTPLWLIRRDTLRN